MTQPTPKTPAFMVGKTPVYHAYKGDSPVSYWYRLTPDENGTNGKGENLSGAFDVRALGPLDIQPQCLDYRGCRGGDMQAEYEAYMVDFMQWVKYSVADNIHKVESVTLK